jgi:hypothetical protein
MRRAELIQWFGLLGAAIAWTFQLVIGFGVTVAACGPAGRVWGIDVDAWEIALMTTGGILVLLSEAAALTILAETRQLHYNDPPPWGRRHFFVVAAALGNLLFLNMIILSGLAAIYNGTCAGS